MGREMRLSISTTADDPTIVKTPVINGIVNAIAFNFQAAYETATSGADRAITVTEDGGGNRELVNRPTQATGESDSFVHIPSVDGQAADGTADGTKQPVGIFDRGLSISISGTDVVTNAIEVVISIID